MPGHDEGRATREVEMETFLVQVWEPADEVSPDTDLRGLVRHIATGEETPFRGAEEVLHLLRQAMERNVEDGKGARMPARVRSQGSGVG